MNHESGINHPYIAASASISPSSAVLTMMTVGSASSMQEAPYVERCRRVSILLQICCMIPCLCMPSGCPSVPRCCLSFTPAVHDAISGFPCMTNYSSSLSLFSHPSTIRPIMHLMTDNQATPCHWAHEPSWHLDSSLVDSSKQIRFLFHSL